MFLCASLRMINIKGGARRLLWHPSCKFWHPTSKCPFACHYATLKIVLNYSENVARWMMRKYSLGSGNDSCPYRAKHCKS